MHDIVARLHLLQLFHGERHLTTACGVRAQTVFVEAVEYLMVGKEACRHTVVGKSFMQGLVNRQELYPSGFAFVCQRGEDVFQAFILLGAVGKDIKFISAQHIVFKSLCQQVEVLMEQWLRRHVKLQRCRRCARRLGAHLHTSETRSIGHKACSAYQHGVRPKLLHHGLLLHLGQSLETFFLSLLRKAVMIGAVYNVAHIQNVFSHNDGVFRQKAHERHFLIGQRCQLGHYLYALALVARQLALHFKGAYRVYFIAEKVDTERIFAAI